MKTLIFLITIYTLLAVTPLFSQEVHPDSIKPGKIYKMLLVNGDWTEGEILGFDSLIIKIRHTDGHVFKIAKNQVSAYIMPSEENVSEYYENKYIKSGKIKSTKINPPYLQIGGGIALTDFFLGDSRGSFPNTYIIDAECTYFFSRDFAGRININCNFSGNSNNSGFEQGGYSYEGGNTSIYFISFDILTGNHEPEAKTNQYFTSGIGVMIMSESERRETYNGTQNYVHQGDSYSYPGMKLGYGVKHKFNPNLIAGAEIFYETPFEFLQVGLLSLKASTNFKISKNIGLYVEPQYAFPIALGDNGGFFVEAGYFTVKAGLTYGLF